MIIGAVISRALSEAPPVRSIWRRRRKTADALLDRFGTELFTLARELVDDSARAEQLVRQTITARRFSLFRHRDPEAKVFAREFAGLIYLLCFSVDSTTLPSLWNPPSSDSPGAALRSGLRVLPDDHRAALALCVFGGQTYRQTAVLLSLPVRRVAELLREALQVLDGAGRIAVR